MDREVRQNTGKDLEALSVIGQKTGILCHRYVKRKDSAIALEVTGAARLYRAASGRLPG